MPKAEDSTCVRLFGETVQMGTTHSGEWELVRRKTRSAHHLRKRFWRVKGHAAEKLRMLHLIVFLVIRWCAGACFWRQHELKSARTLQLHMCRRAPNLRLRRNEDIADYNHRAARWCEIVLTAAKLPRRDAALLSPW